MRALGLLPLLAYPASAASPLSKAELAKLDGHLLVANQLDATISIFPSDKTKWEKADALWSYTLKKGKDGLKYDYPKLDDVKRVVNSNGEVCLLITGNHGTDTGGVALYNMEKGNFEYSACPQSGFHSADLLPDGNIVVADPTKYLLLMTPSSSKPIQSISVGTHSAVWDQKNKVVWVFGGASMHKYSYSGEGSKARLKLECNWKPKSKWVDGGHDMSAMNEGNKLAFTCNTGIGTFDMSKASCSDTSSEEPWNLLYDPKKENGDEKTIKGKGIHYNHKAKEFAFSHPDKPSDSKNYPSFRTYQVRNPDKLTSKGMTKSHVFSPSDKMAFRIARWFIDSPFSYPSSNVTAGSVLV